MKTTRIEQLQARLKDREDYKLTLNTRIEDTHTKLAVCESEIRDITLLIAKESQAA
jgi:hypothetical protein